MNHQVRRPCQPPQRPDGRLALLRLASGVGLLLGGSVALIQLGAPVLPWYVLPGWAGTSAVAGVLAVGTQQWALVRSLGVLAVAALGMPTVLGLGLVPPSALGMADDLRRLVPDLDPALTAVPWQVLAHLPLGVGGLGLLVAGVLILRAGDRP